MKGLSNDAKQHGDLSEFNVPVGAEGLRGELGRFAQELLETEFAREMWAVFEQGELTADSSAGILPRPFCSLKTAALQPPLEIRQQADIESGTVRTGTAWFL